MAEAFPDRTSMSSGDSDVFRYELEDTDEALTADFRLRIGLLSEEEEGLTEAFKARIGLISNGDEAINEIDELELMPAKEFEATLKQFKLTKFCKNSFNSGQTFQFSKEPLKDSLLPKKHEVDKQASLAVWQVIQRFMGDIPTPASTAPRDKTPMMTKIYRTLEAHAKRKSRASSSTSANGDMSSTPTSPTSPTIPTSPITPSDQKEVSSFKMDKRKSSWKKIFKSGKDKDKNKDKNGNELQRQSSISSTSSGGRGGGSSSYLECYNNPNDIAEYLPSTEMDIIHFIVGHGILRRDLRDEIYCQICKQLQKNPNPESSSRGWMLQAMCAGCFLPSDQLSKYLKCYLKDAPPDYHDYAVYTRRIMRRTSGNGMRYHPPNWLEYQATKMRKYVMLPVACADGNVESIEADSATTASEMCHKLASAIGLKETFGFSLYICIYDKVSSLGSGLDHVMDAVSECEQVVRAKGAKEEDAPWRLFFRKELFSPWNDPSADPVASNLVYQQLIKGIRTEEYRCKAEDELSRFVAKRWYIEQGHELVPGKLQSSLHEYLPKSALSGGKSRDGWMQAIMASFDELGFSKKKAPSEQVKWSIVMSAAKKWPLQFAGLFEAFRIAGPRLPKNEVVIAVSSTGFFVLDEPYKVVMALHFYEIVEVFSSRAGKMRGQSFSIITIKGDEFTFISPNSETIAKLMMTFLEGLRKRSCWAVGLEEFVLEDHKSGSKEFRFKQGDLLQLMEEENNKPQREDWLVGRCESNKQIGEFPFDCVYILPAIDRPPDSFLGMFALMKSADVSTLPRKRGAVVIGQGTIGRHDAHGLDSAA